MATLIQSTDTPDVEPDLMFLLNRQGICCEYLTHNALHPGDGTLPSPRDQAVGQPIDRFLPPALAVHLHSLLATVDEQDDTFKYTGPSLRAGHTIRTGSVDTAHRDTGFDTPQFHYAIRLTHCGNGQILCVIRHRGTTTPVPLSTDEETVVDLLQLHNRVLANMPHSMVIVDAVTPDYPILYVNHRFEELTGYTLAESRGRNCRFLQGPESDPVTVEKIRTAIRMGEVIATEILNYRKDGSTFWNALSLVPLYDEHGHVTHFAGIQIDVTERRVLESQVQQVEKLEAISRLAGGVAHDFNNILTVIENYSELVLSLIPQHDPLYGPLYAKVEQIQRAGQRAARLTQQLLAFSRRQRNELEVIDLNRVLQDFEQSLRRLVGEEITWVSELSPDLYLIKADPGQLEQMLINLVRNACDAMPEGGILSIRTQNVSSATIALPTQVDRQGGEYVWLTVQDNGCGIDQKTQSHLFEPFFTTKEVGQGTGLGLATVYGIVNQHQGFIEVDSTEGEGAAFHIYLPRSAQPFPSATATERTLPPWTDETMNRKKTILVVDDEQPILALMAMILEEAGYIVLQATSGLAALDLVAAAEHPFDLLLSDMVMPGMSGHDLYNALLPQRPDLKVVFVSGYTEVRILPDGNTPSRISFLGKPFTWQQLLQKVEEMLNN